MGFVEFPCRSSSLSVLGASHVWTRAAARLPVWAQPALSGGLPVISVWLPDEVSPGLFVFPSVNRTSLS